MQKGPNAPQNTIDKHCYQIFLPMRRLTTVTIVNSVLHKASSYMMLTTGKRDQYNYIIVSLYSGIDKKSLFSTRQKNPSVGSIDVKCCCLNDASVHLEKGSPYNGEDQKTLSGEN